MGMELEQKQDRFRRLKKHCFVDFIRKNLRIKKVINVSQDWETVNEGLIRRGELILDLESIENHEKELEKVNKGTPSPIRNSTTCSSGRSHSQRRTRASLQDI